jgi:hypothetical protein
VAVHENRVSARYVPVADLDLRERRMRGIDERIVAPEIRVRRLDEGDDVGAAARIVSVEPPSCRRRPIS